MLDAVMGIAVRIIFSDRSSRIRIDAFKRVGVRASVREIGREQKLIVIEQRTEAGRPLTLFPDSHRLLMLLGNVLLLSGRMPTLASVRISTTDRFFERSRKGRRTVSFSGLFRPSTVVVFARGRRLENDRFVGGRERRRFRRRRLLTSSFAFYS